MSNITLIIAIIAIVIIALIILFTVKYTKNVGIVNEEEARAKRKKYKDIPVRTKKIIEKLNSSLTKKQYSGLTEQEKNNISNNIKELEDLLNVEDYETLSKKVEYIEDLYKKSEKKVVETLKK